MNYSKRPLFKIVFLLFFLISGTKLFAGETGKIAGKVSDIGTREPLFGANIIILSKIIEGKDVMLDFSQGAATDIEG